jgi:hypothetical protein
LFIDWKEEQSVLNDQNEDEMTEESLEQFIAELRQLQDEFDIAAVKKYKLKNELNDCLQRLDAGTSVIERYDRRRKKQNFIFTRFKISRLA